MKILADLVLNHGRCEHRGVLVSVEIPATYCQESQNQEKSLSKFSNLYNLPSTQKQKQH